LAICAEWVFDNLSLLPDPQLTAEMIIYPLIPAHNKGGAQAMEYCPKKLLDQIRDAIRIKYYARNTEQAYVYWIE